MDKIAAALNNPVLQQVAADVVSTAILEWERLRKIKIRERKRQRYFFLVKIHLDKLTNTMNSNTISSTQIPSNTRGAPL